ncbi:TPA: isoleucine--tRNA ligase [Candidatus Poribacteria bacterium]|nr:isoleucine--tRNA ligase [Candidatus Poribacteria bacterium]HIA66375.1 isoleucine--tRNA ligase [Candidatus Poribacteria bacterium]HIB87606.1 isoleucine--tRNA ligase [Candidatus Poribacteria bacterium]HIO08171.1 isoleucine--tRNA ligase [Candidatus Poribacteria bacterium]HIO49946.1 isoleucine--tRNA ligase [Candidatus Poribacteria bacterium]
MFKEVSTKLHFPKIEEEILEFWQAEDIFQKSVRNRSLDPPFVFLEGPPFANAPPGVHHVLARVMKDAICRYKTMTGHYVQRKAGWDTHGLPIEYQVEKQLNIKNKQELEAYGVKNFIEKCKENVFQYEQDWRKMTERIGFWVDLDDPYITLSNNYIESVWWVLKQAWEKDLLYQGYKVQPYCPRCGTTLANHEVSQGYQVVTDPSIYIKFPVKNLVNTFLLVWTTTPWTLPSNVAIVVGEDYDYVSVEYQGQDLILAKALVSNVFGEKEQVKIKKVFKGKEILDWEYEPLFNFATPKEKAYYVIGGDFVTLTDGTGLVHTAPAFGQDDYEMLLKYELPFVQLVDTAGNFVDAVQPWAGEFVKNADPKIIEDLIDRGLILKTTEYEHEYPFCWRCDTPLLYYARKSWFIRTTSIRNQMLKHNQEINWYPEHIKDGRFGRWLENNIDWGLSRERYWGTPLPVWECEDCGHHHVVGSIQELKEHGYDVPDDIELHRPYIDEIILACQECGGKMSRFEDVIDCWFDSGVAHTAQWHYPFENQDIFEKNYPPDFISEAIDQTRGWFYSLLVTGTLLYDKPAYKNCLCLELITGADGQKMSKSRGNTIDPWEILDKQGADAMRWYLYTSCPPWTPRAFTVEAIDEALKKFMGTLYNVYGFFVMYANLDRIDFSNIPDLSNRSMMDRWLISKLHLTIQRVQNEMENYHITNATRAVAEFVDDLSNWYVRRSRDRFWGAEIGLDKQSAYVTLYQALVGVAKLLAPFTPFIADSIYRNLVCSIDLNATESVHLTDFPALDEQLIDEQLEKDMATVRDIVAWGRALRNQTGIKIRQPLSSLTIDNSKEEPVNRLKDLVLEELNIKEIHFIGQDKSRFYSYEGKIDFKILGQKYGKSVQAIAKAVAKVDGDTLMQSMKANGNVNIEVGNQSFTLKEGEIHWNSKTRDGHAVDWDNKKFIALNTELTEDLVLEGFAREIVNKIQQARKEANFNVSDRIRISIESTEIVHQAFDQHYNYIITETLTKEIVTVPNPKAFIKSQKINGQDATISLEQI